MQPRNAKDCSPTQAIAAETNRTPPPDAEGLAVLIPGFSIRVLISAGGSNEPLAESAPAGQGNLSPLPGPGQGQGLLLTFYVQASKREATVIVFGVTTRREVPRENIVKGVGLWKFS